jgi:hypothetical protein
MTFPDFEVTELLADKPELLAIADAVSATQGQTAQRKMPLRRRVAVRGAIVSAAAAGVMIAVLAWPESQSGGVIGRALAAVGDGRVMYIVTEIPSRNSFLDLKTGHRRVQFLREEVWVDRQVYHLHVVISIGGRVIGDLLLPEDAKRGAGHTSTDNPAFVALWTGYRAALRNGSVTLVGPGTVRGRPVYWLAFKAADKRQPSTEVAVDAHTYKPILYRSFEHGRQLDQLILVVKAIPYRRDDFKRRGPSLVGGPSESVSTQSFGPTAPTAVRAPYLTAGMTVAGLKLRSAVPLTVTSSAGGKRKSFKGLELTYGRLGMPAGYQSITVDELLRPDNSSWRQIPAGSMELSMGEELFVGRLRKDGVYVIIQTTKGERVALEVARALHRAK